VQNLLAIAEVALSFTLLIVGGLLLRSLVQLEQIDAGFQADPQHVLTLRIARSHSAAVPHSDVFLRILERVRELPGVEGVALSDSLPPDRQADYDTFQIEGQQWSQAAFPAITTVIASEDYFRTLRIPLVAGRYATKSDLVAGPGSIVISESVARRYFPGETPIGHRIAPSGPDNHNPWMTIVGVVRDVKYTGLDSASDPALYPFDKDWSDSRQLNLVVRSPVAASLEPEIEREIHAIDPDATLSEIDTLARVKSESLAQPRFRTVLIGGFACVALLLSAIGIYGVIAYTVVQRTNEIGIRMALGAQRGVVLKQVVGDGAVLALAGVAIGCICALLASRALATLLFATSATDPMTFALVSILLLAVAAVASLIPAVRATRIDPITALRCE
jgi:putative ABC transport system permease protein